MKRIYGEIGITTVSKTVILGSSPSGCANCGLWKWSSAGSHKPGIVGSNPTPATKLLP